MSVGGDACVAGTRIAVWTLEAMRRLGVSDAAILANYPGLSANDLAHVWSYVAQHTQEIEEQIVENENA
ncbi:MAG: DUF433 domain-containing protein [Pirellulales bacterium]|nr:DUF433 domain-containing protein [Pirellulales bacterium]